MSEFEFREQDLTTLDVLVDQATDSFWDKEFHEVEGSMRPFTISDAALGAVREYVERKNIDIHNLYALLVKQSYLRPGEIDKDDLVDLAENKDWDNFSLAVVAALVAAEARNKHIAAADEEERRISKT